MLTLGIETSCDETAVAVVRDGREVLTSVVASQAARHAPFGGVVPEIAAREHVAALVPVLGRAFEEADCERRDIDLIAVTESPGLVSALLTGVAAAQAIGLALRAPVVGVNHVEAHLIAPFLAAGIDPAWPLLSLVVSGGHTHLFHSRSDEDHRLLGATRDDAAGEAFDKVAKLLDLGYPGGPEIQRAAASGDPRSVAFKRPYLAPDSLDFSFSGLKTAVLYHCFGQTADGKPGGDRLKDGLRVEDVAASFQACVVDVLDRKLRRAAEQTGVRRIAVGGGVACNGPLRARLRETAETEGWDLLLAPPAFCTDNAAMVAARATQLYRARGGRLPGLQVQARASWPRAESSGLRPPG